MNISKPIVEKIVTVIILLVLLGLMMVFVLGVNSTKAQAYAYTNETQQFEGYSIQDIRQHLANGEQLYRTLRTFGGQPTKIPVSSSEIEHLLGRKNDEANHIVNPFEVTRIRYSERPHSDSIIIVLMGDAFTAQQYGA